MGYGQRINSMNIQSSLLAAVDHVGEGITLSDPNADDHPLIYANEGFCRLTGYNSDEIIGRNCRFLQGEATSTDTVAQIRSCIANERSGIFEIYNYKKMAKGFGTAFPCIRSIMGKSLLIMLVFNAAFIISVRPMTFWSVSMTN